VWDREGFSRHFIMKKRSTESFVIVITGAAQGIGFHLTHHLLRAGHRVVAIDQHSEALERLASNPATPDPLLCQHADVADARQVQRAIEQAVKTFGSIHVLINNAAISDNQPIETLSPEAWRKVIDVNLTGPFLTSKFAAPYLRQTRGCILNFASTRALMSEPDTEAYSASKGGILALTHSLAMSLGPEIRVNSISPGWIDVCHLQHPVAPEPIQKSWTEADHRQHPCGRVGRPEDIAGIVDYLIHKDTTFVTGQNFIVDGGMTRKMIYHH